MDELIFLNSDAQPAVTFSTMKLQCFTTFWFFAKDEQMMIGSTK